jgi:hypothetical protein
VSRNGAKAAAEANGAGNGAVRDLFAYEARYEGRQIATIRGREADGGIVVETEVFSLGADEGVRRPFAFSSRAQAQQFVEEALTALEYLNCTIID